eukprot:COSAG06_NODE_4125_length_4545_cov_30.309862_2_plen_266_part_00
MKLKSGCSRPPAGASSRVVAAMKDDRRQHSKVVVVAAAAAVAAAAVAAAAVVVAAAAAVAASHRCSRLLERTPLRSWRGAENVPFLSHFIGYKTIILPRQARDKHMKSWENNGVFCRHEFDHHRMTMSVVVRAPDGARFVYAKGAYEKIERLCRAGSLPRDFDDVADAHASKVRTRSFPPTFHAKIDHFTKTGSGQTYRTLKKGCVSSQGNYVLALAFRRLRDDEDEQTLSREDAEKVMKRISLAMPFYTTLKNNRFTKIGSGQT